MRTTRSISYFGGQSSLPMSLCVAESAAECRLFPRLDEDVRRAAVLRRATRGCGRATPGSSPAHESASLRPWNRTAPLSHTDSTTAFARQPIADDDAGAAIALLEKFQLEREPIVGRAHAEDGEARGDERDDRRRDASDAASNMHGSTRARSRRLPARASTQSPAGETADTTSRRRACRESRSRTSRAIRPIASAASRALLARDDEWRGEGEQRKRRVGLDEPAEHTVTR